MSNDAKKRYKKKLMLLRVELYLSDQDIKNRLEERLQAGEPKSTYIKRLIREDIERRLFTTSVTVNSYEENFEDIQYLVTGGSKEESIKYASESLPMFLREANVPAGSKLDVSFITECCDEYVAGEGVTGEWNGEEFILDM